MAASNPDKLIIQEETSFLHAAFIGICQKRNIDPLLFLMSDNGISAASPLSAHVQWVFDAIYSKPYRSSSKSATGIARFHHGITHVSRAAFYLSVLVKLYKKYHLPGAEGLQEEDIKLLQIAILFHDTARMDEGIDHWDHKSAILFYYYATRILHSDIEKARALAEAMANKDIGYRGYFNIREGGNAELTQASKSISPQFFMDNTREIPSLLVEKDNDHLHVDSSVSWFFERDSTKPRTIYQQLIHDSDCLDIIRARFHFDSNHLDFRKLVEEHCNSRQKELALEEMARLIIEVRSLIAKQGDTYESQKPEIKKRYEHSTAWAAVSADITAGTYPLLYALSKGFDQVSFDEHEEVGPDSLPNKLDDGKIFLRGVVEPHGKMKDSKRESEIRADLEIRKTTRTLNIPTNTTKGSGHTKDGNPYRSVSMAGFGAAPFSSAGFVIIDPDLDLVHSVSDIDCDTAHGKKDSIFLSSRKTIATREDAENELNILRDTLKKGGFPRKHSKNLSFTHNEILYCIKNYDGIYYSYDRNLADQQSELSFACESYPFIQAIFLRDSFAKAYSKTKDAYIKKMGEEEGVRVFVERFGQSPYLPLMEYSSVHHTIRTIPESELNDDNILQAWRTLAILYLETKLSKGCSSVYEFSAEEIKCALMTPRHENISTRYSSSFVSADINYPEELQSKITHMIEEERERAIELSEVGIIVKIKRIRKEAKPESKRSEREAIMNVTFRALFFSKRLQQELRDDISAIFQQELSAMNETKVILSRADSYNPKQAALMYFNYSLYIYRMFCLADQLQLIDITDMIKRRAEAAIEERCQGLSFLLLTEVGFDSKFLFDDIYEIILSMKHYQLNPALNIKIKEVIDIAFQRCIKEIESFSPSESAWRELAIFIEGLIACNALFVERQLQLEEIYRRLIEQSPKELLIEDDSCCLLYLVSSAKGLGKDPIPIFTEILSTMSDGTCHFFNKIVQNVDLTALQYRLDFFELLLNKLEYNGSRFQVIKEDITQISPVFWLKQVVRLRGEGIDFSPEQLSIIESKHRKHWNIFSRNKDVDAMILARREILACKLPLPFLYATGEKDPFPLSFLYAAGEKDLFQHNIQLKPQTSIHSYFFASQKQEPEKEDIPKEETVMLNIL